jgi:hypothetical protein
LRRPPRQRLAEGRSWRRRVGQVVVRDYGKCHICGHYGAKSADHIIPDTEGGSSNMDNLKAVHGVGSPCPDCSIAAGKPIYCNEIRQAMSIGRARRLIEQRTGLTLCREQDPSGPEGRDWLRRCRVRHHQLGLRVEVHRAHLSELSDQLRRGFPSRLCLVHLD